jgi:hypothetical protein
MRVHLDALDRESLDVLSDCSDGYGPGGSWSSMNLGNFAFINGPGMSRGTIQRIGPFSYGNFSKY